MFAPVRSIAGSNGHGRTDAVRAMTIAKKRTGAYKAWKSCEKTGIPFKDSVASTAWLGCGHAGKGDVSEMKMLSRDDWERIGVTRDSSRLSTVVLVSEVVL